MIKEDFTQAGAMMSELRCARLRKEGHVKMPDADLPALVIVGDETLTADEADEWADFLHDLASNARGLNRGRFP